MALLTYPATFSFRKFLTGAPAPTPLGLAIEFLAMEGPATVVVTPDGVEAPPPGAGEASISPRRTKTKRSRCKVEAARLYLSFINSFPAHRDAMRCNVY